MTHPLFTRHQALLEDALNAARTRSFYSAFSELPKSYGGAAAEEGRAAFDARLHAAFELQQAATVGAAGHERSPYGFDLDITYPKADVDGLFAAITRTALPAWRQAGREAWVGVALEILHRLNRRSFEIAYAVMHTTGQAFMMAFQAGGPHAQDRGLEAVAYAWDELRRIPVEAIWEKPQGKNEPLKLHKRYTIVPRGIGLVIGCCTFPTWNAYPGLFASLATGNAVMVKPHPAAILPLAITVAVAREVLAEAGFSPELVTLLAHDAAEERLPRALALRPEVRLIDFTGSSANGTWLEQHARQARVYTEKAGVNPIIIDSTSDLEAMARNIAFSLSLYSGQMCTAPQNIYVPKEGIDTLGGRVPFDGVADAIGAAIRKLVADPARAVEVLGAVQNEGIAARIAIARNMGEVVVDSTSLTHPQFPDARIRTPLLLKFRGADEETLMQEWFGPIAFVVATEDTAHSIEIASKAVAERGAITLSAYTTRDTVMDDVRTSAEAVGVAVSFNLLGGIFVNQSAAFSDFHATGANPAANACFTDAAFVADRFRVVQSRRHL
ncbi:phenylacetic acid degradation protein PaaN [Pendulispora rubella]|uniref:Phenylacetic acid degradation protein PaaN n=1 Tax=Pendulispora rubella TaxID=2741070 RepID=A0ABZ2L9P3_9BACT